MAVDYEARLIELLRQNTWFMNVLQAIRICDPPDWLVGGGVIRNVVWDYLHGYSLPTPIKDVDVAYFDGSDVTPQRDDEIESRLREILPSAPWEARNQAAVHLWYERVFGFGVEPLLSSSDAIGTWPEYSTCVAVRLLENSDIVVVAPYGLDDLFHMVLRRNPRRVTEQIFLERLRTKRILEKWPKVTVIYDN